MKKTYTNIFAACTAICLLAACAKDENQKIETPAYEKLTINASVDTKTILNDDRSVDWLAGDAISVFSGNITPAGNNKFESETFEGKKHAAKFSGEVECGTSSVIALYPYTSGASYSDGAITGAVIPTTQSATVSSFGNGASVSLAKGDRDGSNVTLEFVNLCSVLKFTLPENITDVTSITVTGNNGEKLAGNIGIDCETPAITSPDATSVTLSGTFAEGSNNAYCVTVAPGTYSGFTFNIVTENGNYTRQINSEVTVAAGVVYPLGILSYAVDDDDIAVTLAIAHTYDNMEITGSAATINVTPQVPEAFSGLLKNWKIKTVTISQNGVPFRTLSNTAFTAGEDVLIPAVDGKPYMPSSIEGGVYDYTAEISYEINNGVKDAEHTVTVTGTVKSNAPDADKFTIQFNFAGYTNFSVAKGYDGQSKNVALANTLDNSTVWGIGEKSYKSGLSADVYTQCVTNMAPNPLLVYSDTKYDNVAVAGTNVNKTKQSWAAHTISCDVTFDGVSPSTQPSKKVHVTGLPYKMTHPANEGDHPWESFDGNNTFGNEYIKMIAGLDLKQPIIRVKSVDNKPTWTFWLPEETTVSLYGRITTDRTNSDYFLEFKPNGVKDSGLYEIRNFVKSNPWTGPTDAVMNGNFRWEIQYHCSAYDLGKSAYVYSFNIDYR